MNQHHDLIVIGAGMAGVAAANKCAADGWRVAIVDELPYGGTCALRGCDPKKILRRGAEIVDAARLMSGKGIDAGRSGDQLGGPDEAQARLHRPGPRNMEDALAGNGVETLHGRPGSPSRASRHRRHGSTTADRFLVAAGARPRPLDFPGAEHLIDSTDFLDLAGAPCADAVHRWGFVSFEFAHLAARAGSRRLVVDRGDRPLKGFDPDLVELLVDTRRRTTDIELQRRHRRRSRSSARSRVSRDRRTTTASSETVEADLVVHGAGRVAALADLGLTRRDVAWGEAGVLVHGHLQSIDQPAVWAAGDSADTAGMPLTPVAVSKARSPRRTCSRAPRRRPDHTGIPSAVFTIPGAGPGRSERAGGARRRPRSRRPLHRHQRLVLQLPDRRDRRPRRRSSSTGTDTIVGAHLLGPDYAELINFWAWGSRSG